jgi:hypothetical protein
MAWLRAPILRGSGNRQVVKAKECQKPFEALAVYLAKRPGGVWQSLQTAAVRWLALIHPSYYSRMM